ncbi:MAG: ATP-binding protein [Hyphomonadaceae bacterium]
MSDKTDLIKRLPGRRLFQVAFIIAVLIATVVTLLTISGLNPIQPFTGYYLALITINFVLIVSLAIWLVNRYRAVQTQSSSKGSGRLINRFLVLFSLSSVIPATVVAIVMGAAVTKGANTYIDNNIAIFVEDSAKITRENYDKFVAEFEEDTRLMAQDIDYPETALGLRERPLIFADFLGAQAGFRSFRMAYVINEAGDQLATAQLDALPNFIPPDPKALDEANMVNADPADGRVIGLTLYENTGLVTALVKLEHYGGLYLYVLKETSPSTFSQYRQAETALGQYRDAEALISQLSSIFFVAYFQIVALALLLFAWLGLEAASSIAGPIGSLAAAAQKVRDGDLTARVPPPGSDDEIDELATSFNTMTAQLGAQRGALMAARSTSENRRQFLETLLSQVSAGVIRTDQSLTVTLANSSAEALIGQGELQGRKLGDIMPEFRARAQYVLRERASDDASLEIGIGGDVRHIRLRTQVDGEGGCVLTFDDATRIVTAQRHMAWRDVARRIAHEIRNPLTPIQLSADRLSRRYADKIDDDGVFVRSLETINRQAADIGRMVDEFSNFARMPKPNIRAFDFSAMLNHAAFAQGVGAPDISVTVEVPEPPITLQGDERLLRQAFANLTKNALEAIQSLPEDMEVVGHIKLIAKPLHDTLEVIVEDNGPGFPKEAREKLLEPYVTTRDRGTGLGLAIVNRVIVDHGGQIMLAPRPDGVRGARVCIVLPLSADKQQDGNEEERHVDKPQEEAV